MNAIQESTLRKAAVWLATLLVLLQCGWAIVGCVLSLRSIQSPVFPSFEGLNDEGVCVILGLAAGLGCCQVVAAWRRNALCTLIIGGVFTSIGMVGLFCGFLVLLTLFGVETRVRGDPDCLCFWALGPVSLVGTWVFVGLVMLAHGIRVAREA